MNGLREKIADAIAGAVSQDDRYLEHADAVLRVLADHGGTQQVREDAVTVLVATELLGDLGDWSHPVRVRVDETPGTGTGYEMTFQTVDREAVQQLDQVRAAFQRWSGGPDDEFEQTMRALLDAPAERDRRLGLED